MLEASPLDQTGTVSSDSRYADVETPKLLPRRHRVRENKALEEPQSWRGATDPELHVSSSF